jgi:hypothetical protein
VIVLAAGFTEQAEVTNWPVRIALVAAVFAIIAAVLAAMLRGWRMRQRRQADIPEPPAWDDGDEASGPRAEGVSGLYVGTATAGDWLDRIAVHGLGVRSRADVVVSPTGIGIRRVGASSFFIPKADILGFRTDRGVAGTVRAKDSVIVITWRLGQREVDTGFRADDGNDHRTLLDGLMVAFPGSSGDHSSEGAERIERVEGETS